MENNISESSAFFYLIKNIYPIVFFSGFVYVLILFLNAISFYKLQNDNPVIIVGYIALIHILSFPIFKLGINGNSFCFMIFPYINLIWIIGMSIGHFVIYKFIPQSFNELGNVPFHYLFCTSYFGSTVLLEIFMLIYKSQSIKRFAVPLDTKESEDNEKSSKDIYKTIIVTKPVDNFKINSNWNDEQVLVPLKNSETKKINENRKTFFKKLQSSEKTITNKETLRDLIDRQNSIRNILNNNK